MGWLRFRKARENEQKRQMVSKMISSFSVTAVVATVAIVVRSNPPTASLDVRAVNDVILYRTEVADPDSKITPDSLKVTITTPLETYETPIALGATMDEYVMTKPDTKYTVSVKAEMGFGLETLASASVSSKPALSGAIANVYLDPETDLSTHPYALLYHVRALYSDPKNELEAVYFEYAVTSPEWEQMASEYSESYEPYYMSIPFSAADQDFVLEGIPNGDYTVSARIAAYRTHSTTPIYLDQYTWTVPTLSFSGYFTTYTLDPAIDLSRYPDTIAYDVSAVYEDPAHELSDIRILYGLTDVPYGVPESWQSLPLSESGASVHIEGIPYGDTSWTVAVRLVGYRASEAKDYVLNDMTWMTPLPEQGGAIADYALDPSVVLSEHPYYLTYDIHTRYDDPLGNFAAVYLDYGYEYTTTSPMGRHPRVGEGTWDYQPLQLAETDMTTMLSDVPNQNVIVHLRLRAVGYDESETILDETSFHTPVVLNAYMYVQDLGCTDATLSVYREGAQVVEAAYTLDVYQAGTFMASYPITFTSESGEEAYFSYAYILLSDLTPETDYAAVLRGDYLDPDSGQAVSAEVMTAAFVTAPTYTVTVSGGLTPNGYGFTILVNDPANVLSDFLYYVYDTTDPTSDVYLSYGYFTTTDEGAERTYQAIIQIPSVTSFRFDFYMSKSFNDSYYSGLIYTLSV